MIDTFKLVGKRVEPNPDPIYSPIFHQMVGPLLVSTVFLGSAPRRGDGPPLPFETMILDDGESLHEARTATWEQAERAHAEAVAIATARVNGADRGYPDSPPISCKHGRS